MKEPRTVRSAVPRTLRSDVACGEARTARKDAAVYGNPHGAVRQAHRTLHFIFLIPPLMSAYRRFYIPEATWFFTVNLT